MTSLLERITLFTLVLIHSDAYMCKDDHCVVDCTLDATVCTNSNINGTNATSLDVICNGDSICSNLTINCPQTFHASDCNLICDGNTGCDSIWFDSFNSNASIQCGNNSSNAHGAICSNMRISSSVRTNLTMSHHYDHQNISINCTSLINDENGSISPSSFSTCTNITIENVQTASKHNVTKNININCNSPSNLNESKKLSNIACQHFVIRNDEAPIDFYVNNFFGMNDFEILNTSANFLNIRNYGNMTNIKIPSRSFKDLNIWNGNSSMMEKMQIENRVNLLMNNGTIQYSNISSISAQNTFNISPSGLIANCNIVLVGDPNSTMIIVQNDGRLSNNSLTLHGNISITVSNNGILEYNVINLTTSLSNNYHDRNQLIIKSNGSWNNNSIYAQYTELLNIETYSLFSGQIFANDDCTNFSLNCINDGDVVNTCNNLTLYTAPMDIDGSYPTNLRCGGYGCQYLTIYSLNGLNDINFSATECLCTVDCIDVLSFSFLI